MELSTIFAKKTHPPLSARKNKALKEALAQAERNLILDTLNEKKSLRLAAEELKIDISTLVRKKRKYKIKFDGSFD
jgi:transcriptional regulator with PAS, ATPase and Fis domain